MMWMHCHLHYFARRWCFGVRCAGMCNRADVWDAYKELMGRVGGRCFPLLCEPTAKWLDGAELPMEIRKVQPGCNPSILKEGGTQTQSACLHEM